MISGGCCWHIVDHSLAADTQVYLPCSSSLFALAPTYIRFGVYLGIWFLIDLSRPSKRYFTRFTPLLFWLILFGALRSLASKKQPTRENLDDEVS